MIGDTWRGGKSFIVGNIIKRLQESGCSILYFDVENAYEIGPIRQRAPQETSQKITVIEKGTIYV